MLPGGFLTSTGGIEFPPTEPPQTVPTLAMYDTSLFDPPATPTAGSKLWDTFSTWVDLDFDDTPDPGEYLNLGGYTHQPVASTWRGRLTMAVGAFASGFDPAASNLLAVVDLRKVPTDPEFVEQFVLGSGGSPALAGANLYSIGLDGLCAFGPEPHRFDVNNNDLINAGDLATWERGNGSRDVNDDGLVTLTDRDALVTLLRANEASDMVEGRN
jgi:hypothetical protein